MMTLKQRILLVQSWVLLKHDKWGPSQLDSISCTTNCLGFSKVNRWSIWVDVPSLMNLYRAWLPNMLLLVSLFLERKQFSKLLTMYISVCTCRFSVYCAFVQIWLTLFLFSKSCITVFTFVCLPFITFLQLIRIRFWFRQTKVREEE